MASITTQPNSVKSILDIYRLNDSFVPTSNSLVLMSTMSGTMVVGKAGDIVKFPVIFNEGLSSIYCKKINTNKYKDLIPLRG